MQIHQHALLSPALGTQRTLTSLHFGHPGSGQKSYIQASLHADELPGMLVAHHLRGLLEAADARGDVLGEVVLVPLANPIGLNQTAIRHHFSALPNPASSTPFSPVRCRKSCPSPRRNRPNC